MNTEREPTEPIKDEPEEYVPINYTEPTERVLRFQLPSDNPLNSQSYIVTFTGNEINYDVEMHTLTNGKVLFRIISPELESYDIIPDELGIKLIEKESVLQARTEYLENKIVDQERYEELTKEIEQKESKELEKDTRKIDELESELEQLNTTKVYDTVITYLLNYTPGKKVNKLKVRQQNQGLYMILLLILKLIHHSSLVKIQEQLI